MKYLNRLTDTEVERLIRAYVTEDIKNIEIERNENNVRVKATVFVDDGTVEDNYRLKDFSVDVVDWAGDTIKCLKKYRQFMLDKFGTQYAVDYLLSEVE